MKNTFLGLLFLFGITLIILGTVKTFPRTHNENEYSKINQEYKENMSAPTEYDSKGNETNSTTVEQARQGLINRGVESNLLTTDEILELWEKMNNENVTFINSGE